MDPPKVEAGHVPEKIEDGKDEGLSFHCELYDTEVTHKIAQELLPGLATACVDNTTGGVFKFPASVAVDMRKEMVEYLTKRSESFVAESVILVSDPEAEIKDHPCDIIAGFIDDFTSLQRNWFSRVSGWVLSEKREDKIDDFQQELDKNDFWPMERREPISQTLVKNVDLKNIYHCNMKFKSAEDLAEHAPNCSFRIVTCENEGCMAKYIAAHVEKHDSTCPYKILPCEQKCEANIMRREMDKHCITVCPMKLMNCPFHSVGCESTIPFCKIEHHRMEALRSHLMCILKDIHKEISTEDLEKRLDQLEKISSSGELSESQTARALTNAIKSLDAKLGPLGTSTNNKDSEKASSADKDSEEVGSADKGSENANSAGQDNEEAKAATKVSEEVSIADRSSENVSNDGKDAEEASATNKVSDEVSIAEKASENDSNAEQDKEEANATNNVSEEVIATEKAGEEVIAKDEASEEVSDANKANEEVNDAEKASEEVSDANKANEEVNDAEKASEDADAANKASEEVSAANNGSEEELGNKVSDEVSNVDKVSDEVNESSKEVSTANEASGEVTADPVGKEVNEN